ncbi:MAG: hypothetical protein IJX17_03385 [Clostridia bacterium]|nr:hypothetical protein [Clostridia bacterium]
MLVYRYMCKDEYDNIMKLDFDKVGGVYAPKGVSNTFKYKRDERYLHFFKEMDDMEVMQKFYLKDGKDYYFCSFDIPFTVLLKTMGKGYYEPRGYDMDYASKREYAIPVSEFNPKWIQDAILDEKKHEINENAKQFENNKEENEPAM